MLSKEIGIHPETKQMIWASVARYGPVVKTLNKDNPKLNCRIRGLGNFSPKRIIFPGDLAIEVK